MEPQKKFTKKQQFVLQEIYRRLNFFHKGDVNADLLLLATPSVAKPAKELGLIKASSYELGRVYNWYNLTDKGKQFFSHYINPIDDETNAALWSGKHMKSFDPSFII